KSVPSLPRDLLARTPATAVVVDTGNYYPQRDGRIAAIENGMTESGWVAEQLGWPVVKAFNNIMAQHLMDGGKPTSAAKRIALPVAGDDDVAKRFVLKLINELGFDGVDAGGLDQSWRQQPGSPVYGADLDADGVLRALGAASEERPAQFRAPVPE
ncbi:MAG: NADP oxidoreductase, partial [Gemmatimonadaceae bacterium]